MYKLKHKVEKIDNDKIIMGNDIKKLSRMVKQSDINIGYILTGKKLIFDLKFKFKFKFFKLFLILYFGVSPVCLQETIPNPF